MNPFSRLPKIRTRAVPQLIAACGLAGLLLRLLINATGIDGKGLMIPGNFAWICTWLVTAAAAAVLAAGVLPIRAASAYRPSFPRSVPGAAGCGLAAVSALLSAWSLFRGGPDGAPALMFYLQGGMILLAVAAFVLVAFCRFSGQKPSFLFHVAICAYFALEMLNMYRTWSFDPQFHEYIFQLFACVALTMTAYQLAAFDLGRGSHRKLWAWSLAAVYLCCLAALSGPFFVTGGIWAFTNRSTLRRPRQRPLAAEEIPAAE